MTNEIISFEAQVEALLQTQWTVCTLQVVVKQPNAAPRVVLVDADGSTIHFSTPVTLLLSAPSMQCDAANLESSRQLEFFDEDNEASAKLKFPSRLSGRMFLAAVSLAVLQAIRQADASRRELNVTMALNATACRNRKGVEGRLSLSHSVHMQVLLVVAATEQTLDPIDAWPESDDVALSNPRNAVVHIGGPDFDSAHTPSSELDMQLLQAKEGMEYLMSAVEVPVWLAEVVPAASKTPDVLTAVVMRVTSIQQNDDAKKEQLRKRLQRQGAGMGPLMQAAQVSNDSLGRIGGGSANNSFAAHSEPIAPRSTRGSEVRTRPLPPVAPKETNIHNNAAEVQKQQEDIESTPPPKKASKKSKASKSEDAGESPSHTLTFTTTTAAAVDNDAQGEAAVGGDDEHNASPVGDQSPDYYAYEEVEVALAKIEKKRQKLQKREQEIAEKLAQAQHVQDSAAARERETASMQATLEAQRAELARQQDILRTQQTQFKQMKAKKSSEIAVSPASTGNPTPSEGSLYVLRLNHPHYDPSFLPPSLDRCYPATHLMLLTLLHPVGVLIVSLMLGGGVGLLSQSLSSDEHAAVAHYWPLIVFFLLSWISTVIVFMSKTRLYETLHRIDQSYMAFPINAIPLRRTSLFRLFPVLILSAASLPLLVLLDRDMSTYYRAGFIVGLAGSVLAWGSTALLFALTVVTAWDRVILCVSPDPGSLCRKIAMRQALAQYQYLKTMMANVSREWSLTVLWAQLSSHVIMMYCLVEALYPDHSFEEMVVFNVVFCVAAIAAWWVQRMTSGWKGATQRMIGYVAKHCDRWARGDYNSEADVRVDDFVSLQQSLDYACQGSSYPRWVVNARGITRCSWGDESEDESAQRLLLNAEPMTAEEPEDVSGDSVWGRSWMYVLGLLVIASAALLPVTCIYRFNSLASKA